MSALLSRMPSFLTGHHHTISPPASTPPSPLSSSSSQPTTTTTKSVPTTPTTAQDDHPRLLFCAPPPSASSASKHQVRFHLPSQLPEDDGKLTVVLDLDETLIHSKLPRANDYRQDEDRPDGDATIEEEADDSDNAVVYTTHDYPDYFEANVFSETFRVHRRPGLDQFLQEASQKYELVCFTAGIEAYAKVLMDEIDPENKYFRHRLYRDHCVEVGGSFVKDLSVLNRPMERCVLVDNNAFSFLFQLGNGIPVSSFYDNAQDRALDTLLAFLTNLQGHYDVRDHLRQVFSLEALLGESARMAIEAHFNPSKQKEGEEEETSCTSSVVV